MPHDYDRRTILSKAPGRLAPALRGVINHDLDHAGFGGQKRFRSMSQALSQAFSVLSKHGIEPDEVADGFLFRQPKGSKLIDLAFSNEADPFSPLSIDNTGLFVQWEDLAKDQFEVIAYVS
jgi:hypothetical protein